eukprot:358791-Chlamydomonas_euryale.AAC.1
MRRHPWRLHRCSHMKRSRRRGGMAAKAATATPALKHTKWCAPSGAMRCSATKPGGRGKEGQGRAGGRRALRQASITFEVGMHARCSGMGRQAWGTWKEVLVWAGRREAPEAP